MKTKRRKKTLIQCQRMLEKHGTLYMEVIVPSWHLRRKILIPITTIPQNVLRKSTNFPDNRRRFLAQVDLEAKKAADLDIKEFENICLLETFTKRM
jgi:hypothetical protein